MPWQIQTYKQSICLPSAPWLWFRSTGDHVGQIPKWARAAKSIGRISMEHHPNQNGFTWKRIKPTACITAQYKVRGRPWWISKSERVQKHVNTKHSWFFYFDEKPNLIEITDSLKWIWQQFDYVPHVTLLHSCTSRCTLTLHLFCKFCLCSWRIVAFAWR